ncbi:serine/threonine-protein kinase [Nocardiopsis ganjiahuensis]|uniref:serine/threonine-protein kinase n=1 Tax=Nocardiopsis ganjiahuensis TaxID=239984 RepID=UPI000348A66E|nr:serine/threonine-protein kinase [Nocardiopsis ganjiahuensis]
MNIGDVLGGFELRQVLGRGGFGTVYLGRDRDGRFAAVKVLHHHYADNPQFRARFKAEVEHSMRVVDFCIARVLDADPDGNPPWVATEYVDGPTLRQQVHSGEESGGGPLPEGDLYRIAVATATALTAIHASDVVHRDFTPSNIMIAPDGIRVIDFGIARALENSPVSASALLGTPRYMAPEQFLGTKVTPAIDVFAWGSVIAFAGTGRDIFTGENLAVTLRKVLFDKPDLTGLPDNLAAVVRWCLYKDPQLRPTSNRLLATLLGVEEPGGGHTTELLATYGGRTDHDILTMGLQIGQGSRTIDISAIPTITQAPPDRDELFEFGGESYSSAAALAQGMQRNWDKALDLLRNAPHRQDLLRWLPEGQERARWIVGQLPEDWGGADVQAANLIVELAPSLAPLFNGIDMSWSALFSTRDGRAWPYRGEEHRRIIRLVEHDNLLEPFSRHRCMGADHGCESNEGCAYYEKVARQTTTMFDTLRKCEAWLEQLGKGSSLTPDEISPEERGDLVHFLATSPLSACGKHDLAAWAVERIPKGPELDQVFRAVCNSEDPWPAAVAFHAHGEDFRELVERFERFEQAGGRQPGTGRTKAAGPEPRNPEDQDSEIRPPEPEPDQEPQPDRELVLRTEWERITEKRELLEQRDPKAMVRFFYALGATLVVLAGVVGVAWDSMAVLVVVFTVTGLLFGVIGRVMAHDHEKALRALDEEWDRLSGAVAEDARGPVGQVGSGGAAEDSGAVSGADAGTDTGAGSEKGSGAGPEVDAPARRPAADLFDTGPSEGRATAELSGGTVFTGEGDIDRSTSSVTWFGKRSQEGPSIGSASDRTRPRPSENAGKGAPERGGSGRTPVGLDADAWLAERGASGRTRQGPDPEATEDWSPDRGAVPSPEDHRAGDQHARGPLAGGRNTGEPPTEE